MTAAQAESEQFTLQEYFTPTERKRLRRFPHLVKVSFGIVLGAARQELIEIVAMQAPQCGWPGRRAVADPKPARSSRQPQLAPDDDDHAARPDGCQVVGTTGRSRR
jgi:hypothetical protein